MPDRPFPIQRFPALEKLPGYTHAFITRVAGLDVKHDKPEVLRRLDSIHRQVREQEELGGAAFVTAEQVHGSDVWIIDAPTSGDVCVGACDGLITNQPNVCLGIYVADCCAVYLVDPANRCIGLVHSGRKGSELDIAGKTIDLMAARFGSDPQELIVQLSPCIRPPHYEVDFAEEIRRSCAKRGVKNVHDSGLCTACDLERYYSYRAEKGKTGRMLALLAITG